jgi:hypothetical protein
LLTINVYVLSLTRASAAIVLGLALYETMLIDSSSTIFFVSPSSPNFQFLALLLIY